MQLRKQLTRILSLQTLHCYTINTGMACNISSFSLFSCYHFIWWNKDLEKRPTVYVS